MTPFAHIMGIPVEETAAMFAPTAAVTAGVLSAAVRRRWRAAHRRVRRPGGGER